MKWKTLFSVLATGIADLASAVHRIADLLERRWPE
jgi:hypothetical protein